LDDTGPRPPRGRPPEGLDLAAKAVGLAASRREPGAKALELEVQGAPHNTSTELKGKLCDWSGYPALSVVVRPFTTDTESLDADVKSASLLLMPSRSEGFGLVGLEGIVAGTPVLVSAAKAGSEQCCGKPSNMSKRAGS
jgi:glycosyltransferase involved in cell wall biosynthesis